MRSGTMDAALLGEGSRTAADNIIAGDVLMRKARRDAPADLNLAREAIVCGLGSICHDKHTSIRVREIIAMKVMDFIVESGKWTAKTVRDSKSSILAGVH